jgi:EAL domain-containing protein (putative c-di-GMP-specific phosphodiesterase class I)
VGAAKCQARRLVYGTGFASLAQLTRVPFTELKINQGFVAGCGEHPAAHVIVEAGLALARVVRPGRVGSIICS